MGGRAFDDTKRICRSHVFQTCEWLEWKLDLDVFGGRHFDRCLLGSAGKKDTSGDIDLNIDASRADFNAAAKQLTELLGADHVWPRPGNSQIFCAVPITGNKCFGRVQVDFMFGDFAWQQFSYGSPGEDSKFKGLYRTELIKALVAFNSDWTLIENHELVARVGPTFFDSKGLIWRYRHRPWGKKDPTKRVQAFAELPRDEFKALYPTSRDISRERLITPSKVVDFILPGASVDDCYSYETLWRKVRDLYSEEDQGHISRLYFERLNSLKVEIPPAILSEHKPIAL